MYRRARIKKLGTLDFMAVCVVSHGIAFHFLNPRNEFGEAASQAASSARPES
jgi:hypothetical protein